MQSILEDIKVRNAERRKRKEAKKKKLLEEAKHKKIKEGTGNELIIPLESETHTETYIDLEQRNTFQYGIIEHAQESDSVEGTPHFLTELTSFPEAKEDPKVTATFGTTAEEITSIN